MQEHFQNLAKVHLHNGLLNKLVIYICYQDIVDNLRHSRTEKKYRNI